MKRASELVETKFFAIFRSGRHTDMHGRRVEFSDTDIEFSAAVYNPARFPAPVFIGHPDGDQDKEPAYGRVASAVAKAGRLYALADVTPSFADLVRAGRYKSRSASFFMPQATLNPCPGCWYLRHVAFLGAMPPAVSGLGPPNFSASPKVDGCFAAAIDDDCESVTWFEQPGSAATIESARAHRAAIEIMAIADFDYLEAVRIIERAR